MRIVTSETENPKGLNTEWHVYLCDPIDCGWHFLPSVDSVAAELANDIGRIREFEDNSVARERLRLFLNNFSSARSKARDLGWDCSFQQGPVVFWYPDGMGFQYGFAWKQKNNGDTFVAVPSDFIPHGIEIQEQRRFFGRFEFESEYKNRI